MAAVLAVLGLVLHAKLDADLTNAIDMQLRSRAQVILAAIARGEPSVVLARGDLIDPDEAFAQVLDATGGVVDSSEAVRGSPMVGPARLRVADTRGPLSLSTRVRGVDDPARLLVVAARGRDARPAPAFVVVGSTLGDRNEALARLTLLLAISLPIALAVVSAGGWLVAGAALRPVELMRAEASAISESGLDRRLAVPPGHDELTRLATTLNDLLARLEEAFARQARLVDEASHELRTPLAVLKVELDLAASGGQTPSEAAATLERVRVEVDRLVRLAEDLLVLARIRDGRLPVRPAPVAIRDLLENVATAYRAAASAAGAPIAWVAPDVTVSVDGTRVRQALEAVLDNALRYGAGRPIEISASVSAEALTITARDHGPGFARGAATPEHDEGTHPGLGLDVARAVALAHGGTLETADAADGGALVTLVFRTLEALRP